MQDEYQEGRIIYSTWGYDQTNVDFYKIVKRTKFFVTLEPMRSAYTEKGFMTGEVVATDTPKSWEKDWDTAWDNKDGDGPLFKRKLHIEDGKVKGLSIKFGWATIWDGEPKRVSSYA